MKKKKKQKHFDTYGKPLNIGDSILLPHSFIGRITGFETSNSRVSIMNTTCGPVYSRDGSISEAKFYEVILMPDNLKVFVNEDTTFGQLVSDESNESDYILEVDTSMKLQPLIENDFDYLKKYLKNILTETAGNIEKANLRYEHSVLVATISKDLYEMYVNQVKKGVRLSSFDTTIMQLSKYHMGWTVEMCGYIHDMFKYSKSKKLEHGKIAAKQFSMFCKMYDVEMWDIPIKMKEALSLHSEKKRRPYSNPFFDILCDADVLSKYTLTALEEKIVRNDWINDLDGAIDYTNEACKEYVPKTPFFNTLKESYISKMLSDVEEHKNARIQE